MGAVSRRPLNRGGERRGIPSRPVLSADVQEVAGVVRHFYGGESRRWGPSLRQTGYTSAALFVRSPSSRRRTGGPDERLRAATPSGRRLLQLRSHLHPRPPP